MENLVAGFQGKLVAVGPVIRTTERTMKAAVRLEELAPSRGACICELCRNNHIENQNAPASRLEAEL
jgi:hypothetical protein